MKKTSGLAGGLKFYLIGSAAYSPSPRDIDLVIVYNSESIDINELLAYRDQLKVRGRDTFDIPLDICLLSNREVESNSLLDDENAILLQG